MKYRLQKVRKSQREHFEAWNRKLSVTKMISIRDDVGHKIFVEDELRAFLAFAADIDRYMSDVARETNVYPSCTKGCSYCCDQAIPVNELEARLVTTWITKNFNSEQINQLIDSIDIWKNRFIALGLSAQFVESNAYKEQYFNAHLSCPFLSETNTCTIYQVRPNTCRVYFSYGEPKDCSVTPFVDDSFSFGEWGEAVCLYLTLLRNSVVDNPMTLASHIYDRVELLPFSIASQLSKQ